MMAKMKSVCASGRNPHFARELAEPDTEPAARRQGHLRLDDLVAGRGRSRPTGRGRPGGGPAGSRSSARPASARPTPRPPQRASIEPGTPAQNRTANTVAAEHERRAEVRLRHQQQGDGAEQHEDGAQHLVGPVDPRLPATADVAHDEQRGQLGQLRRLELHDAEVDPSGGTVAGGADAGHEHGDEERDRRRGTARATTGATGGSRRARSRGTGRSRGRRRRAGGRSRTTSSGPVARRAPTTPTAPSRDRRGRARRGRRRAARRRSCCDGPRRAGAPRLASPGVASLP